MSTLRRTNSAATSGICATLSAKPYSMTKCWPSRSLLWDPGTLAMDGNFQPAGPQLPIEFSRISGDSRLTLVVDESCGAACATYVTRSARADLNDAIAARRRRCKPRCDQRSICVGREGSSNNTIEP